MTPTPHWPRSDLHPPHLSLVLTWFSAPRIHRAIIEQVASRAYLLNKFIQHLLTLLCFIKPWVESRKCCGNAAWIVYSFTPTSFVFTSQPSLFFVFCLWSDFIPYATELFGPVGRWCSPPHTVYQRHHVCCCMQSTCIALFWPALTCHPVNFSSS